MKGLNMPRHKDIDALTYKMQQLQKAIELRRAWIKLQGDSIQPIVVETLDVEIKEKQNKLQILEKQLNSMASEMELRDMSASCGLGSKSAASLKQAANYGTVSLRMTPIVASKSNSCCAFFYRGTRQDSSQTLLTR